MRAIAVICCYSAVMFVSCQREKRDLRPAPPELAIFGDAARESPLRPGGPVQPQPVVTNPYSGSSYDIAEGQRLYNWYNCSGCHSQGGGGIGPPLIKKDWIYGGEPENLLDTIVKGRPNGMPSWGGRIPIYQIWQIIRLHSFVERRATEIRHTRPQRYDSNESTDDREPHGRSNKMKAPRGRRFPAVCPFFLLAACAGHQQSAVDPAGPQAARIAHLLWFFVALLTAIFLVVLALTLWTLVRRHRGAEDERLEITHLPSEQTERKLTRVVTAATVMTVTYFLFCSYRVS